MRRREEYMEWATARWGSAAAEEMREQIEKTADAVEAIESHELSPDDEPAGPIRRPRD